MAAVRVTAFDHLVLACADVERTLAWYTTTLGLTPVQVDEWHRGEVPFPSVRVTDDTIIDLIAATDESPGDEPRCGHLDHICLVVAPIDLEVLRDSGDFDVVEGPARRSGARGTGTSLYVRDPDGLVVELRHY